LWSLSYSLVTLLHGSLLCQPSFSITSNNLIFFFQAEDGIRDFHVTGVQTCALPIWRPPGPIRTRSGSGQAASASTTRSGPPARSDRKSVVQGKSVDVTVRFLHQTEKLGEVTWRNVRMTFHTGTPNTTTVSRTRRCHK